MILWKLSCHSFSYSSWQIKQRRLRSKTQWQIWRTWETHMQSQWSSKILQTARRLRAKQQMTKWHMEVNNRTTWKSHNKLHQRGPKLAPTKISLSQPNKLLIDLDLEQVKYNRFLICWLSFNHNRQWPINNKSMRNHKAVKTEMALEITQMDIRTVMEVAVEETPQAMAIHVHQNTRIWILRSSTPSS